MKKNIAAILLLAVAAVIAAGSVTVIGPCVHADGSAAACTDTGRAVLICGCVLAALAAALLFVRSPGVRTAIFLVSLCASVVCILLPGTLMPLCRMDTMHCRAVMQPSVMILSGIAAAVSLTGAVTERRKVRKTKA